MRFAMTLTLLSALTISVPRVLAIPVPGTDTISNDLTSLAARELSYESTVEARAFDFDAPILEERGIWRKLKNTFTGGSSTALEGRELGGDSELLERGEGTSSTPPVKGGGVSSRYRRRSLSAADLRARREELEQRDIRVALGTYLSLRRRELERDSIVERSGHGRW
ncbi:hypothetical protein DFP72DRAFT_922715 [Ephemerocybe angulata]|uniref:Uncharacterized protein n=1 Tax=Ephemerocybe angulata TaxID=980116 RepID=A0A8H6LXN2_9AGAR|nr:hypothetical protein DFP72DRAFT_922715 [Tulosesus angulatus]